MELPNYVAVYIPSKDDSGRYFVAVRREVVLDMVKQSMIEHFGGYIASTVECGWMLDNTSIMEEVTIITSFYAPRLSKEALGIIRDIAKCVKNLLTKDMAVTIEHNGGLDFVK